MYLAPDDVINISCFNIFVFDGRGVKYDQKNDADVRLESNTVFRSTFFRDLVIEEDFVVCFQLVLFNS